MGCFSVGEPKHKLGELVYHPQYGLGTIYQVEELKKNTYLYCINWAVEENLLKYGVAQKAPYPEDSITLLKKWLRNRIREEKKGVYPIS
jgi:hypothetical protein